MSDIYEDILMEESNKLIAEFMGGRLSKDGHRVYFQLSDNDARIFNVANSPITFDKGLTKIRYVQELKYHSSWDSLMPVANEIIKSRDNQNADWDLTNLKYSLQTTNIELVYQAVVEIMTSKL